MGTNYQDMNSGKYKNCEIDSQRREYQYETIHNYMGLSTCTHGKSTTHTQAPPKEVHERRNWTLIASNPCFKLVGLLQDACCQMFCQRKWHNFCRTFPLCEAIVVRASKPHSSKLTCKSLDMGSTLLSHVYLQSL